jgi:hypothetical protein
VQGPQPILSKLEGPVAGKFILSGSTEVPGSLVTERATSLTSPILWQSVQTNDVPTGSFSFEIPLNTSVPASFLRLRAR